MSRKVLIVDDSKLARMTMARLLSSLHSDWSAEEAADADQALALFKKDPADLVLLDFNMPGKDGLTLAQELKAFDPQVGVAIISANRQVEVVNRTRNSGATFLPKPLTAQTLSEFLTVARTSRVGD